MKALVIRSEGPIEEIELVGGDSQLKQLQELVGGYIEAVPLPEFDPACKPNMRATDFFVPGIGLMYGDHIAGTLVLCGFDAETGEHAELPQPVIDRARLIETEAG
jgi:hypothetical protein